MSNPFIPQLANKSTPVAADLLIIADSQNSNNEKNTQIGQVITNNKLVAISGTYTNGNVPQLGASNTITDTGIAASTLVSITGGQTSGHITIMGGSGTIKDSGIAVDSSQNMTNVGTINGIQITNTLLKTNNLSDLNNVATARTNLGLGNAAVKGVTDNTKANVASVSGTFTTGHFLIAADASGTIQDGGSENTFLRSANNLSDVASKTTSFNNVSPLTTLGDLIGFDGANNVRVPGSATDNYVLTYDHTQTAGVKWAPVPSPGDQVRVITNFTLLTAADFGKTIVCQGSTSYTVELPGAYLGTNAFIYFVIDTTSNALVTILPAGVNTISGQDQLVVGGFDGFTLMTDGTQFLITDQTLYPVSMRAYASLPQTLTNGVSAPFQIDTVTGSNGYDIGSSLNALTYTVIPKWPGKYELYYKLMLVGVTSPTVLVTTAIRLNGITNVGSSVVNYAVATGGRNDQSVTWDGVLNGSTDALTFPISQVSSDSANQQTNNNAIFSYVQLKRISFF